MSTRTHGGLTYNSVSDAIHAHDRKGIGREGKGREGNRRSPSIHNVTQVTREAAPEQTVTPADEWMEDFDFEAEVPCGNPDCNRPADYVIRGHGSPLSFLACRPCREMLKPEKRWCPTNAALETADEHWEIVEVIR